MYSVCSGVYLILYFALLRFTLAFVYVCCLMTVTLHSLAYLMKEYLRICLYE